MTDNDDDLGRRYADAMDRHRCRVLTPEDEELLRELLRSRDSRREVEEAEQQAQDVIRSLEQEASGE